MGETYIRLPDFNSDQSHQNPDDSVHLENTSPTNRTNEADHIKFNVGLICVRFLVTAMVIASMIGTLKGYEKKGNFSPHQKTTFNVIITGEGLCLGLNFFDSFKDLAKVLRWKILERYKHDARVRPVQTDLIVGMESLIKVVRLGWKSWAIPRLCIFCILWIVLNLVSLFFFPYAKKKKKKKSLMTSKSAQVSVALFQFTYSLQDGTDWKGTYTQNGIINGAKLDCYYHPHTHECPDEEDAVQGLANAFGMSPPIFERGTYDQIQEVVNSTDNYGYFCRNTPVGECTYRFVEYNPDDQQRTYPLFTNRTITASAGPCYTYWETEKPTSAKDTSGIQDAFEYKIFNGSVHDSIIIPQQLSGVDATIYIYRGIDPPHNTTNFTCGDRCIWMWAHKTEGGGENSTFYQCPITIGTVTNTNHDTQIVPDSMARLAASAIALQGRWAVNGPSSQRIWTQFRFYPYSDDMELHGQNATKAGADMVEFAIRSLSTMAFRNPSVQVPGLVPHLGTRLEVDWKHVAALSASIVGVQTVLSISIIVYGF